MRRIQYRPVFEPKDVAWGPKIETNDSRRSRTVSHDEVSQGHEGTASAMVAVLLVMLLLPAIAAAETLEKPALKQGYYFSLTPAFELVFVDSKQNFGPWPSGGGQLRMGEALTRWLDLGLAGGVSVAKGNDLRLIHGHFGVEATLKPTRFWAFGVQAGMGFADFTRQKSGMAEVIGRFGATYGLTVQYDFFPGSRKDPLKSGGLALTPMAGVYLGPADTTSVYSIFIGLSVSWWTGLSKNKLDLPLEKAF
ncbi:MAG: hypothetical protein JXR76_20660 [Deltaproteobacteria bacterium]|nr:hypothetical protein [Deltaproteobacteria bacterium]